MPDVKKSKAMNTLQTSFVSVLEIWVWCFEIKDSMLTCSFYKPLLSHVPSMNGWCEGHLVLLPRGPSSTMEAVSTGQGKITQNI